MPDLTWLPFDFLGGWNPTPNVQTNAPGLSMGLQENELESCQDFHNAGAYRLESRLGADKTATANNPSGLGSPNTGFINGLYEYRLAGAGGYTSKIMIVCGNSVYATDFDTATLPAALDAALGTTATCPATFITFNNKVIIGKETDINKWDQTTYSDIAAAPSAWILCGYRRRVWATGCPTYPWRIYYSDIDDEETWGAEAYIDLEGHAAVKALVTSYNEFFALCEGEIWQVINTEYITDMQAVQVTTGITAITQRACVSVHGDIYFLATDSIYRLTSTGEIEDLFIDKQHLKAWYRGTIDVRSDNITMNGACGAYCPELQSIIWSFPSTSSSSPNKNNTCICMHVPTRRFSKFNWTTIQSLATGLSSGGGATIKKHPLYLGDQTGNWYVYGGIAFTNLTDDVTDMVGQVYTKYIDTAYAAPGERDLRSAFLWSEFQELKFFYTTSASVNVAITASVDGGDPITIDAAYTMNGSGCAEVSIPPTIGRRIQLRFDVASMNTKQIALYDGLLGFRQLSLR